MGCYDTVRFTCPHCNNATEVQSKAGECHLVDYEEESVPLAIAGDLDGQLRSCCHCHAGFKIVLDRAPSVVAMKAKRL